MICCTKLPPEIPAAPSVSPTEWLMKWPFLQFFWTPAFLKPLPSFRSLSLCFWVWSCPLGPDYLPPRWRVEHITVMSIWGISLLYKVPIKSFWVRKIDLNQMRMAGFFCCHFFIKDVMAKGYLFCQSNMNMHYETFMVRKSALNGSVSSDDW